MINLLVKLFVKNYDDVHNAAVRQSYGILGGSVGIVCNLLLFIVKLSMGMLTGAISIMADAFNNLSDAASSVVTLIGFKMAGKPADKEHPFGHGRIEYLSGLFISAAIMMVGWELGKGSFDKILHPETLSYSIWSILILIASVLVKFWMAAFNRKIGERIQSAAMKATAADSLSDCIATSAVLVSIVVGYFTNLKIDGVAGLIVSIFIFIAGIQAMKDTIQPLLGQAPDPEFVKGVQETILSHEEIVGIHDMIVHDYGPGRVMVSVHAEIPDGMDIMKAHDIIDDIEMDIKREFNCDITIHMDPVVLNDKVIDEIKYKVLAIVKQVNEKMTIHDFRMTTGPLRTNLIFDVMVPFDCVMTDQEIIDEINMRVKEMDHRYYTVIQVDKGYV